MKWWKKKKAEKKYAEWCGDDIKEFEKKSNDSSFSKRVAELEALEEQAEKNMAEWKEKHVVRKCMYDKQPCIEEECMAYHKAGLAGPIFIPGFCEIAMRGGYLK